MSYSSTNPIRTILQAGFGGQSVHLYSSTHAATAIAVTGFFKDAARHGLRVGDLVCNIQSTAGRVTWHQAINSTKATTGWNPQYSVTVSGT